MTRSLAEPRAVAPWSLPDLRRAVAAPRPVAPAATAVEAAEEAAYRRGFEDGCAARDAESARTVADAASAMAAAVEALARAAHETQARVGATVPALALAVSRHLIEREVQADPTIVDTLVRRALAMAPLTGTVTVRLHPGDLAAVQAAAPELPAAAGPRELKWVPDPSLHRGSCVVETPTAVVDGRVDRALLDLYDRLVHD